MYVNIDLLYKVPIHYFETLNLIHSNQIYINVEIKLLKVHLKSTEKTFNSTENNHKFSAQFQKNDINFY